MVEVKICGLTDSREVSCLLENGVAYAGCVMFYPNSKRNIQMESAVNIIKEVRQRLRVVAVVVSPTIEQVQQIQNMGFDIIQIHGELKEEVLKHIKIPIFRAFNIKSEVDIQTALLESKVKGIVLDAGISGAGKTFDWNIAKNIDRQGRLLILAGGLDCENVIKAIEEVKPDIVDVSSGVEYKIDMIDIKGKDNLNSVKGKDPVRIKRFVDTVNSVNINI